MKSRLMKNRPRPRTAAADPSASYAHSTVIIRPRSSSPASSRIFRKSAIANSASVGVHIVITASVGLEHRTPGTMVIDSLSDHRVSSLEGTVLRESRFYTSKPSNSSRTRASVVVGLMRITRSRRLVEGETGAGGSISAVEDPAATGV